VLCVLKRARAGIRLWVGNKEKNMEDILGALLGFADHGRRRNGRELSWQKKRESKNTSPVGFRFPVSPGPS
jgi:hypothetical protein